MSTSSVRSFATKGLRPLRVGATPVPHAEILDNVRPELAARGIDLQITVFDSFDEPNDWLAAGRLHANYFQYLPFLEEFNRRTGNALVPVVAVHIEPFGLYSTRFDTVAEVADHAEVALPSDAVNTDRSLRMLDGLGLIECVTEAGVLASVHDVRANPRGLVFKELTSWTLPSAREDFDVVFLFGNQAMEASVDTSTALHCDRANPAYAEYLVAAGGGADHPDLQVLATALNSAATRAFIASAYGGQVVPAF